MRWVVAALIALHGLIHGLGFAKGLDIAEINEISASISTGMAVVWLAAGGLLLVTAALYLARAHYWWVAGACAVVLSQTAVLSAWSDAKAGTIPNVVILAGVVYAFASRGPLSFRSRYHSQVRRRLPVATPRQTVTEADLEALPRAVRDYLRMSGSVGKPRVHHFQARWKGRIRQSADDPWMDFTAEQVNFIGDPARFFIMDARKAGLPVDVFHEFRDGSASMKVRLLSLLPIVTARGSDLDRAETVTIFNDMCLLAPAALVDSSIRWEELGEGSVRGVFALGANTISADLSFNAENELIDFVSDDRFAASASGGELVRTRWSTPVREYHAHAGRRVFSHGEGRWHPPEGEYTYLEIELLDLQVNGAAP